MSLRGFGKGFFGAAGPSFVRGMEKQQGRIETRRQEERQDVETKRKEGREDLLLKETRGREDKKEAYERAQTDGQGAANESVEAVNAWYDALPPELQKQFVGTKNQLVTQASRKQRVREGEEKGRAAQLAAAEARTEADRQRIETGKFALEREQGEVSGTEQLNTGSITDKHGYSAAVDRFNTLSERGVTPANAPELRRISGLIDAYSGSSEFSTRVEQGKIRGSELKIEGDIMDNLDKYTPDMIRGVISGMADGEVKNRLLLVAKSMRGEFIELNREKVIDQAYKYYLEIGGKSPSEATDLSIAAGNRHSASLTRDNNRRRLKDITNSVVKMLGAGGGKGNIENIMTEIEKVVRSQPDLNPDMDELETVKQSLIRQLGLSGTPAAALVDVDSVAGISAGAGAGASAPDADAGSPEEDSSSVAKPGSLWAQHDIGGKLESGVESLYGGSLATSLLGPYGTAAYGAYRVADATGFGADQIREGAASGLRSAAGLLDE